MQQDNPDNLKIEPGTIRKYCSEHGVYYIDYCGSCDYEDMERASDKYDDHYYREYDWDKSPEDRFQDIMELCKDE